MDDATFDRGRLHLVDNPDGSTVIVPGLPLKDLLAAIIPIVVSIAALIYMRVAEAEDSTILAAWDGAITALC